ncbi:MAG: hypothetical protein ACREAK_03345 [Nitrosarchaeum sp.]
MSDIRVTYSGLISFLVRISSVFTGIIFTLIVTRRLSEEEFGSWSLIGGLLLYVVTVDYVISYWLTREVARDENSGRTALASGCILSIGGVIAYLIIAYYVSQQSDTNLGLLLFAVILIPLMFINDIIQYLNLGWKPQVVSYALLTSEVTKVPAGLAFVYFLDLGIEGAILATFVAYLSSIFINIWYARQKLKNKIQKMYIKKWFRLSWIPLYQSIPNLAFVSDVVIFSVITGSVIGVAYMTAARAISNIVMHAGAISDAVYPKLIGGGRDEYLQENLVKALYFAIPLIGLTVVLSRPGLFALNPVYESAAIIVIFISFRSFLSILNRIFYSALQGIEKIDLDESATFKTYIKSKLFFVPTLRIIQYTSYAVILIIVLLVTKGSDFLDLITYWAVISLLIEIPFVIYQYYIVQKNFRIKIDNKAVIKYIIATFVSCGILYYLVNQFLNYKISIFEFFPDLLLFTGVGILLYLVITYFTDLRTRQLFSAIVNEIRQKNT